MVTCYVIDDRWSILSNGNTSFPVVVGVMVLQHVLGTIF